MVESTSSRSSSSSPTFSTQSAKKRVTKEYQHQREDFQALIDDVTESVGDYCRNRPMVAGIALFAFGFYVGWRIKPW